MLIKVKTLKGFKLDAIDGEIGKVKEIYFDDKYWAMRYLVADTGGWLTGRLVLISPYALGTIDKEAETIQVSLTKKQIEDSPSLDSERPVSRQFEETYYGYYGWPRYWAGSFMWGQYPYISGYKENLASHVEQKNSWDPHLRSSNFVTGHNIQANDGEIGHVEDFIIDDKSWSIRYLVIDTKNWWPGKKVILSPSWIERLSLDKEKVMVNLSKESIKGSPEYSDDLLLTREYESDLYNYYKLNGYWLDDM